MTVTPTNRTVHLLTSHLVPTLGLERAVVDWVALMGNHFDVEVTCIGGPTMNLTNAKCIRTLGRPLSGWRRAFSIPRLRKWSRTLPNDAIIVVAGIWAACPWLVSASRHSGRTVVWEHSILLEKKQHSPGLWILALLARFLYPRSALVVSVSAALAADVQRTIKDDRSAVIGNNPGQVTAEQLSVRLADRDIQDGRLLAVGSLTATKNHALAIRTIGLLPAQFELHIAGEGPQRAELARLVTELGLVGRVHLLGFVDHSQLDDLYRTSAVVVHTAHAETFGYVFYEAANWGTPVVALSYGVSDDLIPAMIPGEVAPAVPNSIATAIRNVCENPPTSHQTLACAARLRSHLDPNRIRDQWVSVIESAGSRSRSAVLTPGGSP